MWPMIAVSGVRSSWETSAKNSSFIRSLSRSAVTSRSTTSRPIAAPATSCTGAA